METDKHTQSVQAFLNDNRFSGFQIMLFVICFLIAFFDGMDTAAIGYVAPALLDDWGLQKKDLAPVLSAALFGLAIGAISFGPVADKIGRKSVLTFAVILFGGVCALSSFANGVGQMTALRFITGLGLGAAMPNAVTLLSEYCPDRNRALVVNTMYCGFPIGAAAGGFFAAWLIPAYGWHITLMWCGLLPLALGIVMIFLLPDSAAHMTVRRLPQERIRKILNRINPAADLSQTEFVPSAKQASAEQANPMSMVLGRHFAAGSVLLWASYFLGLIIFYAMINWMPVIFKEAHMPPALGPKISGLFALGGLGAIANGYLMDRFNGNKLVASLSLLTSVSVAFIGWSIAQGTGVLIAVVLIAGVFQNTAQSSLPALAAKFYPTECRTTGVSWMLGIGRFGAIAGTFLTGQLLAWKLDLTTIFIILAVPSFIMSCCLMLKQKIYQDG